MTNPGNIVRIRSRNGGHTSVYEANMWAQKLPQGLFSGNGVLQNTSPDMHILVGGTPSNPDVVIGQNPSGYKVALDIIGQQVVQITTPASNSRISSIVAYTNDLSLQSTDNSTTGSPSSCGLIVVNGTTAATPSAPTDTQIRAAITADGATGSQAVYGVIANIPIASTTTAITNTLISMKRAQIQTDAIADASITTQKIDFTTLTQSFADYTGYFYIGPLLIQWGQVSTNNTGTTVTFPKAFSKIPVVMANLNDNGSQDAHAFSITTTTTILRQNYTSPLPIQWMAIGAA